MKKWKYALLIGMMSIALTGCNGNMTEDTSKEEATEESVLQDGEPENEETALEEDREETDVEKGTPFVEIDTTYYESEEEDFYNYFNGSYELATVSGDGYDALEKSVSDWFANYETTYQEETKRMYEDAKSYGEPDGDSYNASSMNHTVKTARADERIVSFQFAEDVYAGGAHGNVYNYGVTFDAQTGKELTFADLGDIREDVKAYIKESIAGDADVVEGLIVDDYNTVVDETVDGEPAWYLTGTGLTVVFNEYELLSYAAGDYVVTIPYDKMPGFNGDYNRGKSYFVPLDEGTVTLADVGDDGTLDEISLECNYSDDYSYMMVDVNVNGNKTGVDEYCYSADGYFLHTEDGKDYILVCTGSDNDFVLTSLIQIEDGVPTKLVDEGMNILAISGDRMWTVRKVDMMGSYSGYCTVQIEDGAFKRVEERYTYKTQRDSERYSGLTTIKEVPCKLMMDGELKDATLPEGTTIHICDSDGESVVGFEMEDGTYGEIYQDISDWPHTIDGIDENELFEMFPYAG